MISLTSYAFVSMMLFSIGVIGVIARRNIFVIYMSIELMLNGVNLFLVTFAIEYIKNVANEQER